ncbi:hypothetical protein GGTG_10868 [Gaeumannomyces tritici R3-111a-1]|uniref:Uncharacterized protein n=1 Tax=Gaeumannomyces tritici (strain R3-111a-1) TaxID=644352 RepID=J3PBJ6_GAET3|nr:hypothetical protein GGTG_10868 [Gaeumannomyces tritici R3-111a-1]EJT71613.1 hypothetical protein GGTG_10868 [Gaeumannomyces tritici R3-111a-1]
MRLLWHTWRDTGRDVHVPSTLGLALVLCPRRVCLLACTNGSTWRRLAAGTRKRLEAVGPNKEELSPALMDGVGPKKGSRKPACDPIEVVRSRVSRAIGTSD